MAGIPAGVAGIPAGVAGTLAGVVVGTLPGVLGIPVVGTLAAGVGNLLAVPDFTKKSYLSKTKLIHII